MSFRDVVRVLARWRWVLAPAVVLALVVAGGSYAAAPREYTQTESYLLLYPLEGVNGPGNPFLNLGNGVAMAASVLATKVTAPEAAARLTSGTPGLTYTVAADPNSTAPILVVTVTDRDSASVSTGLNRVGDELVSQLAGLQRATGAPEVSWVTISRLTRDPLATPSRKAGVSKGAAALAGILVLALLVVTGLEWRERRRRSGAAPGDSAAVPGAARPLPALPMSTRRVPDADNDAENDAGLAAVSGER